MAALLEAAQEMALPLSGGIVFPHARLRACGKLVAAAALAVVRSGRDTVLALGVMHGGRECDAQAVARARNGDEQARRELRAVHGPGASRDRGVWLEEFSLDNFVSLVELAAAREGTAPPRIVARYPFLTAEDPTGLPGFAEIQRLALEGCAIVATTDPVHHGAGYGTPAEQRLARTRAETFAFAARGIAAQFESLRQRDFAAFQNTAGLLNSDFRDVGPVLAAIMPSGARFSMKRLKLVDYSDVLDAPQPTWVAAALATVS